MSADVCSSTVRLNIGGKKFCTTVDTLTRREPHSMLAAMFSGRYAVRKDSEKDYVFIDRDGKHFRHILNWLRDGVSYIPNLSDLDRLELLHEAEYYKLLGLVDKINEVLNKTEEVLNKKEEVEQMESDLTRGEIIKCVQHAYTGSGRVRLIGVNLSGLDLSKLDLSYVDFSRACLRNVNFSDASLKCCILKGADLQSANLCGANLAGASLKNANLQGANLRGVKNRGARWGEFGWGD